MNLKQITRILLSVTAPFFTMTSLHAETLYGPGTITIPTNQAIVINTIGIGSQFYIDGQLVGANPVAEGYFNPRIAIAGHHTLTVTDENGTDVFVTFQRVKNQVIKTVVVSGAQTNTVNIPAGKTVQFFDWLGIAGLQVTIQSTNSANKYSLLSASQRPYSHPSATGPATIEISNFNGATSVVSYYLLRPRTPSPVDLIY